MITYVRYGYLGLFGVWAGAVLCLTLAVVLRKARREARAAIAARTARVWFEVKALWTIFPAFLFWQLLMGGLFLGAQRLRRRDGPGLSDLLPRAPLSDGV